MGTGRIIPLYLGLRCEGGDPLRLNDHVVILDADRERLGLVGSFNELSALRNRNGVFARAQPLRVAPGLAGADVELPRMPGAADDLATPRIAVLARLGRLHQPGLL